MKYKTMPCASFHLRGHCEFGTRCGFLHDEIVVTNKMTLQEFAYHDRHLYFKRYEKTGDFPNNTSYISKLKNLEDIFETSQDLKITFSCNKRYTKRKRLTANIRQTENAIK